MAENRTASLDAPAPETTNESASTDHSLIPFDPVALRHRSDGWTPEQQREYVEALADTGVARAAAARVGMTEQSANRLRRRADARSFDLACEAAMRHGARRLRAVAYERAIEGVVKQHFYHGELKGEERVYDNRLLTYLLGKTEHLLEDDHEVVEVARAWEPWVEAMEQGLPPPALSEPEDEWADYDPEIAALDDKEPPVDPPDPEAPLGDEVWQKEEDGSWWTNFPPPAGFDGEEEHEPRHIFYRRTLSAAERAAAEARVEEEWAAQRAVEAARRDRHFGFAGGLAEKELFSPREAELYEPSSEAARE